MPCNSILSKVLHIYNAVQALSAEGAQVGELGASP